MCMLKRFYCLLIVLCVYSPSLFAQHFMHSAGATISAITGTVQIPGGSESFGLSQTNLTYFPRYNFVENENSSISVGAPIGLGIAVVNNTGGNDALVEKVIVNFIITSYKALRPIPNTICQPKPPLTLREATLTPIKVKM